jgi:hypothetical protein
MITSDGGSFCWQPVWFSLALWRYINRPSPVTGCDQAMSSHGEWCMLNDHCCRSMAEEMNCIWTPRLNWNACCCKELSLVTDKESAWLITSVLAWIGSTGDGEPDDEPREETLIDPTNVI